MTKAENESAKKIYFYKDNKGIYLSHFPAFWLFESKEKSLHSFFLRGNSVEFNCWMSLKQKDYIKYISNSIQKEFFNLTKHLIEKMYIFSADIYFFKKQYYVIPNRHLLL